MPEDDRDNWTQADAARQLVSSSDSGNKKQNPFADGDLSSLSMNTGDPIRRQKTLTEQAADAIRERIVEGQFELGEALSDIALADELGVSKTPIREAFLLLKNEGLVEVLPKQGTFVFRMTMEQLRQLWELREILELNSLRLAMRDGGGTMTRILTPIIERMVKATNEKDPSLFRRCDAEFHGAIIAGSDNKFIQSGYNIIALRVQVLRNRVSLEAHNWRSLDEHVAVLDYIRTGDTEAAVESLFKHIRGTLDAYVAARKTKLNSVA